MIIGTEKIKSVCILSNLYPPVVSGSSTQSSGLAKELSDRGINVAVITARVNSNSTGYEKIDNIHIYRLPCKKIPRFEIALKFPWMNYTFTHSNWKKICNIIKIHKPDVLHLHNHMFDLSFSAVLARKHFGIPLLITIHTIIKHVRNRYNILLYPADRIFLRRTVIKHSDLLISPDYNVKAYVEEAFDKKNEVIPYGIDELKVPSNDQIVNIKNKYNLDGKNVILSVGHVHELRNRIDLINAMPDIIKEAPNTILLIVGAVTTKIPKDRSIQLGVHDNVVFTGPVPHKEISTFLSIAKIEAHWLVQDKPEKTSLGTASLEGMSFGKTIMAVANEDTYGRGVLCNNHNCILVEPNNPKTLAKTIIKLFNTPNKIETIGKNAYETIQKHFTWKTVGDQTLKAYQNAIRLKNKVN